MLSIKVPTAIANAKRRNRTLINRVENKNRNNGLAMKRALV
jgi:hypothetical protein